MLEHSSPHSSSFPRRSVVPLQTTSGHFPDLGECSFPAIPAHLPLPPHWFECFQQLSQRVQEVSLGLLPKLGLLPQEKENLVMPSLTP